MNSTMMAICGACARGAILLIWPEGVLYNGETPERVERTLSDHVVGGRVVRTLDPGTAAVYLPGLRGPAGEDRRGF